MNRFAELLDRLSYEPGRNNKLRLITAYFRDAPDPDRGYALAAMTGALSFKHAKAGLIRDLIAARADPTLFALSFVLPVLWAKLISIAVSFAVNFSLSHFVVFRKRPPRSDDVTSP